jgi:hypothetical protein
MKTVEDILQKFGVTAYKTLASGETAIRKGGMWLYFWRNPETREYEQNGSSSLLYPNA